MQHPRALVIVGHGTRDARGLAEFLELVQFVQRLRPDWLVRPCYLELAQPSLLAAVAELAEQQVRQITVLPLLLFAAGHAKRDIPLMLQSLAAAHPQLELTLASHLGCHERLLAASADCFDTACAGHADTAAGDTLLLFVGRGSYDAEAQAELEAFVNLRRVLTPVGHVRVGFLAMAEPSVEDVLPEIGDLHFQRVIVQPHLLFRGELLDRLASLVAEAARKWPHQKWILAPHLGPSQHLAEAVVDRGIVADRSAIS